MDPTRNNPAVIRRCCAAALVVVAAICSSGASALTCPTKEYAQYKDEAKTPFGRRALAIHVCSINDNAPRWRQIALQQGSRQILADIDQCRAEASKMLDAIQASKDHRTMQYALDGCQEAAR